MSKLKLAVVLCSISAFASSAYAYDPGNLTIKDGAGEEITFKKGLFGKRKVLVKDRLGNKYEKKKGMFGGRSKEVNLLGNKYKSSHSFLGDKTEGGSLLGDTVTVKKGAFGGKTTEVDLSGVAGAVGMVKDLIMEKTKEPFADAPPGISSDELMDSYTRHKPSSMANQEHDLKTPGSRLLELQNGGVGY